MKRVGRDSAGRQGINGCSPRPLSCLFTAGCRWVAMGWHLRTFADFARYVTRCTSGPLMCSRAGARFNLAIAWRLCNVDCSHLDLLGSRDSGRSGLLPRECHGRDARACGFWKSGHVLHARASLSRRDLDRADIGGKRPGQGCVRASQNHQHLCPGTVVGLISNPLRERPADRDLFTPRRSQVHETGSKGARQLLSRRKTRR